MFANHVWVQCVAYDKNSETCRRHFREDPIRMFGHCLFCWLKDSPTKDNFFLNFIFCIVMGDGIAHIQWLLKGPDFGTLSRSGPMSKKSPEKGPICLSSPEVY